MKRLFVAAVAGVAAASVVVAVPVEAATAQAAPQAKPGAIAWKKCDGELGKRGLLCGQLEVPLNYATPNGRKIKLAVSMIPHKAPKSKGIMVINTGGPGGSSFTTPLYFTREGTLPKKAAEHYDWIGYDPRGVGQSSAINCKEDYFGWNRPDYIPRTKKLEKIWLKRTKSYAKACKKRFGWLLPHMKTTDWARDLDSIRKASNATKLNLYGWSYGSALGQTYATMFPKRVGRFVLDGNPNPAKSIYQQNQDQNVGFNYNSKIWFKWLAKHDKTFHLGKTRMAVQKKWYAERRKLSKKPAGGKVGPDEWTDLFTQAPYYVFEWVEMGMAFSNWVNKRDPKGLIDRYTPSTTPESENGTAVYNAVQCTDEQWPKSWKKWRRDNWRSHRKAPWGTWSNAWLNAPCRHWGAKPAKRFKVDGRKVGPILLLGEQYDAATPFSGSIEVRRRFPKSALVEGDKGSTHSASPTGIPCTDNTIADYLLTGALPKRLSGNRPDLHCPGTPQPSPGSNAVKSLGQSQDRPLPAVRP